MKKSYFKIIVTAALFCGFTLVLNSCSKNNDTPVNTSTAVTVIYDHDLLVKSATDNGVDNTAKFAGLKFRFTGPYTLLNGGGSVSNDLFNVNGTWNLTANYDKITFAFPTNVFTDLDYMNKQWLIGTYTATTVILSAANGENDVLQFMIK